MLKQYQEFVAETSSVRTPDLLILYPCLGLAGEIGEVIENVKKYVRDDKRNMTEARLTKIKDEMGDVIWYYTQLAQHLGLSLEEILEGNINKLTHRRKHGKHTEFQI